MKVAAVVPMKLNNRRLPQKNTKPFTNGRPLCWYILSTLLEVEAIEKVYVYCSNPSIQEYLPQGMEYLRRGEDLDQDSTKMNEVLARFAGEVPADVYVMTHTTAPFVRKESIEKGLEAVLSGAYDSAFAVKELRDFLWKDGKPFNYALDAIPRTPGFGAPLPGDQRVLHLPPGGHHPAGAAHWGEAQACHRQRGGERGHRRGGGLSHRRRPV